MEFNTNVKFTDTDKYIGHPLVIETEQGSKYIFTVIKKHRRAVCAMYVVLLKYKTINCDYNIKEVSICNRYVPTIFSKDSLMGIKNLRTPTIEEYKRYKAILRKYIIYYKWK